MLIPKIIHQIYSYNSQLPHELSSNINQLKTNNSNWEHRLYEDADIIGFINKYYGSYVLRCFDKINPLYGAARADLFRYLLMYQCGGVYLDIKSTSYKPLDEVLRPDDQFILSQWRNKLGETYQGWGLYPDLSHFPGGEFQQWHIVARPQHPFLKSVIANVLRNIESYRSYNQGVGKIGVLRTTGPVAYTLSILPFLKKFPYRFVDIQKDLGFSFSIYDGSSFHKSVFKNHYSTLKEPLIIRSKKRFLFSLDSWENNIYSLFQYWRFLKYKEDRMIRAMKNKYNEIDVECIFEKIYRERSWDNEHNSHD